MKTKVIRVYDDFYNILDYANKRMIKKYNIKKMQIPDTTKIISLNTLIDNDVILIRIPSWNRKEVLDKCRR